MYHSVHRLSHTTSNSKQPLLQARNMLAGLNVEDAALQSTRGSLMHQKMTMNETPRNSEQITQFHDELKTFTSKVVGLEKHGPTPMDTGERQACFLVEASQSTAPLERSSGPIFNRVRTRQSWSSEANVKTIDVSNFPWVKRKSSTDDSVGQICVERVYFAADQRKTPGNSHGSTSHLIEQCMEGDSLSQIDESAVYYTKPIDDDNQLVETNRNMFLNESSEMDRQGFLYGVATTQLQSPGANIMKVRPVSRDPRPVTTDKEKNTLYHVQQDKHTNCNAFSDTNRLIDTQVSSANHFAPADSAYINGHGASEYIGSTDTCDPFHHHETCYQCERNDVRNVSSVSYTQHSNCFPASTERRRIRSTNKFLERTNGYNLRYDQMQASTDPQFVTIPAYPKPNYGYARHISFSMSHQDQRIFDSNPGIQGNRQENGTVSASQQQPNRSPNSSWSPEFRFHTYSDQRPRPSEMGFYHQQKLGSSAQHPIKYWLQTDHPLRVKPAAGQFNSNENQSCSIHTADTTRSKRQKTDYSVLHSQHVTKPSENGVLTSPRNSNSNFNRYFVQSCSPTNLACYFGANEEDGASDISCVRSYANKFANTQEQNTDMKNSRKQNPTSIRRLLPISQIVASRSETEAASELHQPFVSQRCFQIETTGQNDCLCKPNKVDANIQVTSSNACVKRRKATVRQITQGTQTRLLTPGFKPSDLNEENLSNASRFTQDINNKAINQNYQCVVSTKRKVEGSSESVDAMKKKKKRMLKKDVPADKDFLVHQSRDISSTTDQFPKQLIFESRSVRATNSHPTSPCEHAARNTQTPNGTKSTYSTATATSTLVPITSNKVSLQSSNARKRSKALFVDASEKLNGLIHPPSFRADHRGLSANINTSYIANTATSKVQNEHFTVSKATQSTNCFNNSTHCINSSKTPSPKRNDAYQKQACTVAIQCTLQKASPQSTTGDLCDVPPVERLRIARVGTSWRTLQETNSLKQANCRTQHPESGLTPIHRVENVTAPHSNPLDHLQKKKQTRSQEVQVCNGKEHSKMSSSRSAATMTSPLHLNQSHDGVLDKVVVKSKFSQTDSGSKTLTQNKIQISKCVEAKLDLRKSPSRKGISQSCQANIDTAPGFNFRCGTVCSGDKEHFDSDHGIRSQSVFVLPARSHTTFISSPESEPKSMCNPASSTSQQRCKVDALEYYKRAQTLTGPNMDGPRRQELSVNQPEPLQVLSRTLHNPKLRHNTPIARTTLPIRKRLLTDWAR